MSAAHTPGPWEAKHIDASHVHVQSIPRACVVARTTIPVDAALSEIVANARLIAAAPEQHAALIDLLDLVDLLAANCADRVDVTNDPRIPAARAAIAKATGSAA